MSNKLFESVDKLFEGDSLVFKESAYDEPNYVGMTSNEAFEAWLGYEGIDGFANKILDKIKEFYGVDLKTTIVEAKVDGMLTDVPDELLEPTALGKWSDEEWRKYYDEMLVTLSEFDDEQNMVDYMISVGKTLGIELVGFSQEDKENLAVAYANKKESDFGVTKNMLLGNKVNEAGEMVGDFVVGDRYVNHMGAELEIVEPTTYGAPQFGFINSKTGYMDSIRKMTNFDSFGKFLRDNGYEKKIEVKEDALSDVDSDDMELMADEIRQDIELFDEGSGIATSAEEVIDSVLTLNGYGDNLEVKKHFMDMYYVVSEGALTEDKTVGDHIDIMKKLKEAPIGKRALNIKYANGESEVVDKLGDDKFKLAYTSEFGELSAEQLDWILTKAVAKYWVKDDVSESALEEKVDKGAFKKKLLSLGADKEGFFNDGIGHIVDGLSFDEIEFLKQSDYSDLQKWLREDAKLPNISKFIYDLDGGYEQSAWSAQYTRDGNKNQIIIVSKNGESDLSAEDVMKAVKEEYPQLITDEDYISENKRKVYFYLTTNGLSEKVVIKESVIAEGYSDEYANVNKATEEYMPVEGDGDNWLSQLMTAFNKIVYKHYNDGDTFDNHHNQDYMGWANDLSGEANWIDKYGPKELSSVLNKWIDGTYSTEDDYDILIDEFEKATDDFLGNSDLPKLAEKSIQGNVYREEGKYVWASPEDDENFCESCGELLKNGCCTNARCQGDEDLDEAMFSAPQAVIDDSKSKGLYCEDKD